MDMWMIKVTGYGSFLFEGTETEAEEMRTHKEDWEGGIGTKRPATKAECSQSEKPTPVIKHSEDAS